MSAGYLLVYMATGLAYRRNNPDCCPGLPDFLCIGTLSGRFGRGGHRHCRTGGGFNGAHTHVAGDLRAVVRLLVAVWFLGPFPAFCFCRQDRMSVVTGKLLFVRLYF